MGRSRMVPQARIGCAWLTIATSLSWAVAPQTLKSGSRFGTSTAVAFRICRRRIRITSVPRPATSSSILRSHRPSRSYPHRYHRMLPPRFQRRAPRRYPHRYLRPRRPRFQRRALPRHPNLSRHTLRRPGHRRALPRCRRRCLRPYHPTSPLRARPRSRHRPRPPYRRPLRLHSLREFPRQRRRAGRRLFLPSHRQPRRRPRRLRYRLCFLLRLRRFSQSRARRRCRRHRRRRRPLSRTNPQHPQPRFRRQAPRNCRHLCQFMLPHRPPAQLRCRSHRRC